MGAAASESCRAGAAVGCGCHAVSGAVECDRGHGDRRQHRRFALLFGIMGIAVGQAEAMAIAVDHHVDIVGVVMCDGSPLEAGVVELPVRRPVRP